MELHSPAERQVAKYEYGELTGTERIRTMRLHCTKHRIEFSFGEIGVSEGGYQALSYVWGSPEKSFKAFVLNSEGNEIGYIPLTTSLRDALQDLRDADGIEQKVFWIDQICINQDGAEKNNQVAMMGQIYRNASRVITYVNSIFNDEVEEKSGIALLLRLDMHFAANYEIIFQAGHLYEASNRFSEFPVVELPQDLQIRDIRNEDDEMKYVDQGWRWLMSVGFHSWTRRLWVVQEQILNREIVILYRTSVLSWDALAAISLLSRLELLPYCYVRRFWEETIKSTHILPFNISDSVYTIWHNRQAQKKNQEVPLPALLANMKSYQGLECWDPRDRVFALLAISSDAKELGITPNYSDAAIASHVFLQASISILQHAKNLEILIHACRWRGSKALGEHPVPESRHPQLEMPSWVLRPRFHPTPDVVQYICHPHPWKYISKAPQFVVDSKVVVLKGRHIDYIRISTTLSFYSALGQIGRVDDCWVDSVSKFMRSFASVLAHLGPTVANTASLCRAIVATPNWQPPLEGPYSIPQKIAYYFWGYFRAYVNHLRGFSAALSIDIHSTLRECDAIILNLASQLGGMIDIENLEVDEENTPDENEGFKGIFPIAIIHGRSFCVTKDGRVCNVMNQAMEGDVVTAFQGSENLWILRPVGKRYQLIGDAYVDGLMNGEAYDGLDPNEVDYDIELV